MQSERILVFEASQIKCGVENVPAVNAYELNNGRGTKIILHVWLGQYRSRAEFWKP